MYLMLKHVIIIFTNIQQSFYIYKGVILSKKEQIAPSYPT